MNPDLQRVLCEIEELSKLGVITETVRIKARKVAEKQVDSWVGMRSDEMATLAVDLASVA
jgi:hypothetical protein